MRHKIIYHQFQKIVLFLIFLSASENMALLLYPKEFQSRYCSKR